MKPFALFFFSLFTLPLLAETWEDPETGIEWIYSIGQRGVQISSARNAKGDVEIPDTLPGPLGMYTVYSISSVFRGNADLESVKLPNSITEMDFAFDSCTNLKSVELSPGITSIGYYTFYACSSLEEIKLPESVQSIGEYAFRDCSKLRRVTWPNNLKSIDAEAFRNCSSLEEIRIPASVQQIGAYAFTGAGKDLSFSLIIEVDKGNLTLEEYGLSTNSPKRFISTWTPPNDYGLLGSVTELGIPEGVSTLTADTFIKMVSEGHLSSDQITTLILPESLAYIEEGTYDSYQGMWGFSPTILETSGIHTNLYLPDSITTLQVPEGTTKIDSNFYIESYPTILSSFTTIKIPDSVKEIAYPAFFEFGGLTSIHIPPSVTTIGEDVFPTPYYDWEIPTLGQISVDTDNTNFISINNVLYTKDMTRLLKVAPTADIESLTIPETITSIDACAFLYCRKLKDVKILGNVENVPSFRNCINLQRVELPEGVRRIVGFSGCPMLTSVTLPSSLQEITGNGFKDCTSLRAINIPGNVKTIEAGIFSNCSSLQQIVLNEGIQTIKENAFDGCVSLTSFHLPASVSSMPVSAFPPAWNMERLTVAEGNPLYVAQDNILYNKDKTKILLVACKGVSGDLILPEGITHLEDYLFSRCENLTSITIPASVTSMGNALFAGCPNLKQIHFMGNVPNGFSMNTLYGATIVYEEPYANAWQEAISVQPNKDTSETKATVTVSCEPIGSKQLLVRYTVHSKSPKARVRAIAFENGIRSFANFIVVRTGEGVPRGELVDTNIEHVFTWDVATDWNADLAKVSVEILACEGTLLPQDLQIIPASDSHKAMTITTNYITPTQAFDALMWCLAEEDPELKLEDGIVRLTKGNSKIAENDHVVVKESWPITYETDGTVTGLLNYLYGKMGFKVLADEDLEYAENALRRQLRVMTEVDSVTNQRYGTIQAVSVKIEEE